MGFHLPKTLTSKKGAFAYFRICYAVITYCKPTYYLHFTRFCALRLGARVSDSLLIAYISLQHTIYILTSESVHLACLRAQDLSPNDS